MTSFAVIIKYGGQWQRAYEMFRDDLHRHCSVARTHSKWKAIILYNIFNVTYILTTILNACDILWVSTQSRVVFAYAISSPTMAPVRLTTSIRQK